MHTFNHLTIMKLLLQTQYYLSKVSKHGFAVLMVLFLTGTTQAKVSLSGLELSVKKARENVTGTVKDEKGETLPGVTVRIKGTNTATVTDANGQFRINLPTGTETLMFSYIGFKSTEVQVGSQTTINVVLVEDINRLTEVVINIGYGTKKKSESLGSSATVDPAALQDIPGPNLSAALRGQVAGVGVNQISGRPGAGITGPHRKQRHRLFSGLRDEALGHRRRRRICSTAG